MSDEKLNNQHPLINYAIDELNKILEDVKNGKAPKISSGLEKIAQETEAMKDKASAMKEDELDLWASKLTDALAKLKE